MRLLNGPGLAAIAGSALLLTLGGSALAAPPPSHHHGSAVSNELALRQGMRKLWEDHITWTRLVIVSTAAGLPDLDPTTQRLLQNQTDIGNAVKPFYGDAAGAKLTELLRAHIIGAADVLAAAKANDATKLDAAKKSWYANGDEIAAFLNGANAKNWPLADMQSMMREHLDLTLAEASSQLQGQYAQSVADYDKVHDSILKMADMLSDGIIKQFPKKF
jgi:hypothetical protein